MDSAEYERLERELATWEKLAASPKETAESRRYFAQRAAIVQRRLIQRRLIERRCVSEG